MAAAFFDLIGQCYSRRPTKEDNKIYVILNPHSENKTSVLGSAYHVLCVKITRVCVKITFRILIFFQDRPMFSHTILKVSAEAFH